MPGRPTWPVISTSEIRHRALSVPWVCWLTPMPQKQIAAFAAPQVTAMSMISSGSTPQMRAATSGG